MKIELNTDGMTHYADLSQPIDISIPLRSGPETVNAFHAPRMKILPIVAGDFVGDTNEGGVVNTKIISINPHGNGTHTECVGHISKDIFHLNNCLKEFMFIARLITILPTRLENGDSVIEKKHLVDKDLKSIRALVIRCKPNTVDKNFMNYSGTNPTYFSEEAMQYIVELGVEHLLVDLPSVDREEDDGKLLCHKAFWQFPEAIRENATITELIYVSDDVEDATYLLNIQITSIESDASPSKPVLYRLAES